MENPWMSICDGCGAKYWPEPCCEGPCIHEAERPPLCPDCEHEAWIAACEAQGGVYEVGDGESDVPF